jgi:quercetin dioxygenase-like cupin family protein
MGKLSFGWRTLYGDGPSGERKAPMTKHARLEAWADRPTLQPLPKIDLQRISGEHAMAQRVTLHPGFAMPEHHHENEQLVVVLSGKVIFGVNGKGTDAYEDITLTGGQVLVLPPNCPHDARAIEKTEILDIFSPPSETTGVDQKK